MNSTKTFTVDTVSKKLVCEVSDLEFFGTRIAVASHRTGTISRWEQCNTFVDGEGEVQGWTFAPTSQCLAEHPQLKGWTLVVYND